MSLCTFISIELSSHTDYDEFVRGIHSVRQIEHHCSCVRCQMLGIPYLNARKNFPESVSETPVKLKETLSWAATVQPVLCPGL
jgi:hypothetical protein